LQGRLFTYACCIAFRNNSEISSDRVSSAMGLNNKSFLNGFFWSMYACGLLSRTTIANKDRVYKIKSLSSCLQEEVVKKYFINYMDQFYDDADEEKSLWLDRMSKIESAF